MKFKLTPGFSLLVLAVVLAGTACSHPPQKSAPAAAYYTCPMHSAVRSDQPGACHICGMTLVPASTNSPAANP